MNLNNIQAGCHTIKSKYKVHRYTNYPMVSETINNTTTQPMEIPPPAIKKSLELK